MNQELDVSSAFSNKPMFTRSELKAYIRTQRPMLKDSTFRWLLYSLCQERIIQHVAHDIYRMYAGDGSLQDYNADLSADATAIRAFLIRRFPLLTFIVWETRAFNEFANHQTVRNYIFIEVEKPLGESVFDAIHEESKHTVLYKPGEKEISLYSGKVTVPVLELTSEAPVEGHNARIEKLLVDLFANKLLSQIVSRGDYPGIYEEAFARYNINYNVMLRYARRRNKHEEIKSFIENKTNITVFEKDKPNDKP